jgi:hypothetical protein
MQIISEKLALDDDNPENQALITVAIEKACTLLQLAIN